jgi:hypothetical protein
MDKSFGKSGKLGNFTKTTVFPLTKRVARKAGWRRIFFNADGAKKSQKGIILQYRKTQKGVYFACKKSQKGVILQYKKSQKGV